jgi:hypothetical protein
VENVKVLPEAGPNVQGEAEHEALIDAGKPLAYYKFFRK